jgi:hypothetical protein
MTDTAKTSDTGRRRAPRTIASTILAAALIATAGCGEGTYHFGGDFSDDSDSNRSVTVTGNVSDLFPPNAVRELVAFAYTDLSDADLASGPPFNSFEDAGSAVVDENGDFTLSRLSAGKITVMFLLDTPEPDGTIDPGDDCSVLVKSGSLKNTKGGSTATLTDVEVGMRLQDCQNFGTNPPAAGCFCSKADEISVVIERQNDDD